MNEIETQVLELDEDYIISRAVPVLPRCGVYFLVLDKKIVYVGQSHKMSIRLSQHKGKKNFDHVFFIECEESELDKIERMYIRKFSPALNIKYNRPPIKKSIPAKTERLKPIGTELIAPDEFFIIDREYKNALALRRLEIIRLRNTGLTQQEIADIWHLDISRINRLLPEKTNGR